MSLLEYPTEMDTETNENNALNDERFLSPTAQVEDIKEVTLRPKLLDQFVGQRKIIDNLQVYIEAAKRRGEHVEHILLHGPPGLGKTTLANIVANEMNVHIKITSGPAIERPGDLAAILTNLEKGDILFIDEIHRLNRSVEEVLYPAMEDFELDIIIGKGPSARSIRLDLPAFTLVGATTRIGLLTAPLRDRFGILERLEFYDDHELVYIISRAANILNTTITKEAAHEIAGRSRGTPRIANRILKRIRDFAQIKSNGQIDETIIEDACGSLGIDYLGLDKTDRNYLEAIIKNFGGGPVGLDTISASISEESDTLEDVVEPYLLQIGFIDRTSRGRMATQKAYAHLGIAPPQNKSAQPMLF